MGPEGAPASFAEGAAPQVPGDITLTPFET